MSSKFDTGWCLYSHMCGGMYKEVWENCGWVLQAHGKWWSGLVLMKHIF